jgi:alpha-L-fucosidase
MEFNFSQYKEINNSLSPDLWWFDGHWWFSAKEWRSEETAALIHSSNPDALINDRLPGQGDYKTAEQGIPLIRQDGMWEACMTTNDSWGYQPNDLNYKSVHDVICMLADCIHLGGNLLLDIGPKPDGTIPQQQIDILRGLGRWTSKHAVAIYDTKPGIDLAYYNGQSTIGSSAYLGSKDNDILYLFIPNQCGGAIRLKGLMSRILRSWVVGHGGKVSVRQDIDHSSPGTCYLTLPNNSYDPEVTVIALMMDGKIKMQELKSEKAPTLVFPAGANTGQ